MKGRSNAPKSTVCSTSLEVHVEGTHRPARSALGTLKNDICKTTGFNQRYTQNRTSCLLNGIQRQNKTCRSASQTAQGISVMETLGLSPKLPCVSCTTFASFNDYAHPHSFLRWKLNCKTYGTPPSWFPNICHPFSILGAKLEKTITWLK